jgi:hypothetical protein
MSMTIKSNGNSSLSVNRRDLLLRSAAGAAAAGIAVSAPIHSVQAQTAKLAPKQARTLEDWSYALAVTAATWGGPLVIMYALRDNDAVGPKAKAAPNNLWRMENITTPSIAEDEGYVLPNDSVLYGFGFLDLRQEPVILSLPDSGGRYYMVETVDMWTNAFAYPAGAKAGYKGGKFAYVGPNWKGDLPPDIKRIDAPTPWILIQPRVHMPNPGELAAAQKVLQEIKVQTLSAYTGKPALPPKYDYPAVHGPEASGQRSGFQGPIAVLGHPLCCDERKPAAQGRDRLALADVRAFGPRIRQAMGR